MSNNIRVGITHGDINGIGYEVIMKTLSDNRLLKNKTVIVYGSAKAAAFHKKTLNMPNFNFNLIKTADEANPKKPNIINCADNSNLRVDLGKSTDVANQASREALEAAVQDLKDGKLDVLITAPISRQKISGENEQITNQVEYLASNFDCKTTLNLLVSDQIRIALATEQMPLSKVSGSLNENLLLDKIELLNQVISTDFNIQNPKIAVLNLNPEEGDEERNIIYPAIEKAKEKDIYVFGPYPADNFWGSSEFEKFDAVLAMYYDQGMNVFRTIAYEEGVIIVAGLPFICTAPGHNVRYDIAGENKASEISLRNALFAAEELQIHRFDNYELESNKLKIKSNN